MVLLNESLIRKRSEHNDGLLADLEEVALHQHEIERIECIGHLCKHLKVLLLQNNLVGRIENLHKLKELEYLNLALNNIQKIENLSSCESLKKLDLTMNFIDFDELDSSLANLEGNYNLEDLYLVGNPVASNWEPEKYRLYVIDSIRSLKQLDGQLISTGERLEAKVAHDKLKAEVQEKARMIAESKRLGTYESKAPGAFTPASRLEMYRELGEQKAEKERKERGRMGVTEKKPRSVPSVLNARGEIRQCNEGGYEYRIDEESVAGFLIVELHVPRFMDSSLIDVDLNPDYVRCVIKGKLTQLRLDSEIRVMESKLERSKTTGSLKLTCPIEGYVAPRPRARSDPWTEPPALEPID